MTVDLSTVGIATAFAAGAMSFLSPCVLPLVPAYVSYIAGESVEGRADTRARSLWLSLFFVFGFTTVFVVLGAGANVLNAALAPYRHQLTLISGALVILFGIFTLGLWRPAWSERELRVHARLPRSGPLPAYLLGMAFAFGWTPCIGPVLGAILALAASSSGGVTLLAVYSLGLGLPFVLAAVFLAGFMKSAAALRKAGRVLRMLAGGIMIAMGVAMMTGDLATIAIWFLETFPALASLG
jgi:cytochrome c-type biogenesis protein